MKCSLYLPTGKLQGPNSAGRPEAATRATRLEAALEAAKRDATAEQRRLREACARAEAAEESLAARLLSSETAYEEARRTYERRLAEKAAMSPHEAQQAEALRRAQAEEQRQRREAFEATAAKEYDDSGSEGLSAVLDEQDELFMQL